MKYTVQELINVLQQFPPELEIKTELAFLMNYPDPIYEANKHKPTEELERIARASATELCIFEGNWETGISDLNGDFEKYYKNREE